MSKFLLNLLMQISKALVNSKIRFLIQKFFFFAFGPPDLAGVEGAPGRRQRAVTSDVKALTPLMASSG
jgi:hypothetical protein